jgi:hypothetical protein
MQYQHAIDMWSIWFHLWNLAVLDTGVSIACLYEMANKCIIVFYFVLFHNWTLLNICENKKY